MRKLICILAVWAAALAPASGTASERTMRMVVPTPPGTSADAMARILAEHMGGTLGATIVVENKPGASGAMAIESVVQQGGPMTALVVAGLDHIVYGPAALGRKPWDPLVDLKPVGLVNHDRWVLVGHPVSAGDLAQLVRTAGERPLRCANGGLGTTQHAVCAWIARRLGVAVDHIPYSQAFWPDLIAGRVDIAAVPLPGAAVVLGGGRARGVMLLSADRHPSFPAIPTASELDRPGLLFESGLALYTTAGVSEQDVDRLHAALQRAQADPAVARRYRELGVDPAVATRLGAAESLRARLQLNDSVRREGLGAAR